MEFKLGKLAPKYDKRTLQFSAYKNPKFKLQSVPKTFGHTKLIKAWGVLGNDKFGDCAWASAAHETMLWGAEAKKKISFTDDNVLSDYAACTGFNPVTGAGDEGTLMIDQLNYRRKTGIVDSSGKRHQICAYVALEPGNFEHVMQAAWMFSSVSLGIKFPESAMDQFNAGKAWSVVAGSSIEGGHAIPLVGRVGTRLQIVTWGKVQQMTKTFFERYCDEAYAILDDEMLTNGKSIEGFDLEALQADLALLGQAA